jgi:hypothetical protein
MIAVRVSASASPSSMASTANAWLSHQITTTESVDDVPGQDQSAIVRILAGDDA